MVKKNKYNLKTIFILVILLLLSLFPRMWKLTTYPPMIVDEAANIRELNEIFLNENFRPWEPYWDFSQARFVYIPSILLTLLLGNEDMFFVFRLTSVILSMLSLIPLFFIIKYLTNKEIAFISTLLFSYSYYFLQFSRVGWINVILSLCIGMYLLLFILKASQKNSLIWIVLSGTLAGLLFYCYRSGTIFIFATSIYLIITLILNKIPIKQILYKVFIFLLFFLITCTPWIAQIKKNWEKYNLRLSVVAIGNVEKPYHKLTDDKQIFIYQLKTSINSWILLRAVDGGGSENPRYLPNKIPPVNFLVSIGFWLGLFFSFLSLKKNFLWLIIFIVGLITGQIMTINPPNGARGIILLPIIYILFAITLFNLYNLSGKSKICLIILTLLSYIYSLLDFLYYQYWMSWIKV